MPSMTIRTAGPLAVDVSSRVAWSHQLTASQAAAYTVANIFSPEGVGTGQYPWYGRGYPAGDASIPGTGSANPSDPNYSWPAFWGDRNVNNEHGEANLQPFLTRQSQSLRIRSLLDPIAGAWDPNAQLALVPEPASALLLGLGGFICWRVRRGRSKQ